MISFTAHVLGGQLVPRDPVRYQEALKPLEGQEVRVEVIRVREIRSVQANRRYWSLVVPEAQEILSRERPVPLSKDQAHYVLKYAFLGHEETPIGPVPKSTKGLTTAEFYAYTQSIEQWLLQQWGVILPERGDE